jgi:hypothetical protein
MLEKTEGEIRNGQSRDTGNIGHTRYRTKTNKTKQKQHSKVDEKHGPHQKLLYLVCPMLPVSLDCPFFTEPLVFSSIYFFTCLTISRSTSVKFFSGKSEMDNLETLATLGTQDTGRRQTKRNKNNTVKLMRNTDPTKNRDGPRCSRRITIYFKGTKSGLLYNFLLHYLFGIFHHNEA